MDESLQHCVLLQSLPLSEHFAAGDVGAGVDGGSRAEVGRGVGEERGADVGATVGRLVGARVGTGVSGVGGSFGVLPPAHQVPPHCPHRDSVEHQFPLAAIAPGQHVSQKSAPDRLAAKQQNAAEAKLL